MDLPEVRQCPHQDSDLFGAVAVRSSENRWGVMNPGLVNPNALGGHWASDNEVQDWTPVSASKRTAVRKASK